MNNPNDFVIENGVLKKYKGKEADVIVPDGVTRIGDWAFSPGYSKNEQLTSVSLPNGLREISKGAFSECRTLTTINLPDSLASIGESAFAGCKNLKTVFLPDGLREIKSGAFSQCEQLSVVTFPQQLNAIEDYAFSGCERIKEIILPHGLKEIGKCSFGFCSGLERVFFPESLVRIGASAFTGCSRLCDARLPSGLKDIGRNAFEHCDAMENIEIPSGIRCIRNGTFLFCQNLKSVVLPETVTSVEEEAFYWCCSLQGITLPSTLDRLGVKAFGGCKSLSEISLPPELSLVNDGCFSDCDHLTEIVLPSKIAIIGKEAFRSCKSLKHITLPQGLYLIGEEAFAYCQELQSVRVSSQSSPIDEKNMPRSDKLRIIEEKAFYQCKKLSDVEIPPLVLTIGRQVFSQCRSLQSIRIPDTVQWIGPKAFAYCGKLETAVLPDGLKVICEETFCGCSRLSGLVIPDTVQRIDSSAFADCKSLANVKLPNGMILPPSFTAAPKKPVKKKTAIPAAQMKESAPTPSGVRSVIPSAKTETKEQKEMPAGNHKGTGPAFSLNTLFEDYLTGQQMTVELWRRLYRENDFFRRFAGNLVWMQDNDSFIAAEDGWKRVDGTAYALRDEAVSLAHPLEMEKAKVELWKKYLASREIRQPFHQLAEPVLDVASISENRYKGLLISDRLLKNPGKKYGIYFNKYYLDVGNAGGYEYQIVFPGFRTKVYSDHDDQTEVISITPTEWGRRQSSILGFLDRLTAEERIRKDDLTVAGILDCFSEKEIADFIDLAQRSGAHQMLPSLIEHYHRRTENRSPTDGLSLEPPQSDRSWMADKIFLLTGFSEATEAEYTRQITTAGGIVKSSTVLATDYVVYNPDYDHETTKLKRAKELIARGKPITILTEEEFLAKQ